MSWERLRDRLAQSELAELPEDQRRALLPAFAAVEDLRARVRRRAADPAATLPPEAPTW